MEKKCQIIGRSRIFTFVNIYAKKKKKCQQTSLILEHTKSIVEALRIRGKKRIHVFNKNYDINQALLPIKKKEEKTQALPVHDDGRSESL